MAANDPRSSGSGPHRRSRGINDSDLTSVDDDDDPIETVVVPVGNGDRWTVYHLNAFLLTFFTYALFHASRKTFSNIKSTISREWLPEDVNRSDVFEYGRWNSHALFSSHGDAEQFLGDLDFCFLIAYAVGLYISGYLGDRYSPRHVLAVGMWLSSLVLLAFGFVSEVWQIYNKGYYVFVWLLSGFIQACGWPNVVCVMGNWFGRNSRGFVLGLWSACASIGNIIGSYLASFYLPYGYEYTFLVTSTLLFSGGFVIWFSLVTAPREVGLPDPKEESGDSKSFVPAEVSTERPKAIGFIQAVLLPGVIPYALAYACLKFVNYSFFFWLPFYLNSAFGIPEPEADKLSTWYDWGGIVGGLVAGVVSDQIKCRSPVISSMLIASIFSLGAYALAPKNRIINTALMTLTGFLINGPANLISGAVSADLGRDPSVGGNAEAIASVTGILDGTGSVGASVGQLLVPFLDREAGWTSVFYMFMVMCFMTTMCIGRMTYRETKDLFIKAFTKDVSKEGYFVLQYVSSSAALTPHGA